MSIIRQNLQDSIYLNTEAKSIPHSIYIILRNKKIAKDNRQNNKQNIAK